MAGFLRILEEMDNGKKIKIAVFPTRDYWAREWDPCAIILSRKVYRDRDKGNFITYRGVRVYENECPWGTKDIP